MTTYFEKPLNAEVSSLNSKIATQYIPLSLHSSQSTGDIHECKMTKAGNVVSISGYISGLSASAGGATILTFPAEYRPKQTKDSALPYRTTCIIGTGYDASNMGGVAIGGDSSNGSVWIYSGSVFTSCAIGATWIC